MAYAKYFLSAGQPKIESKELCSLVKKSLAEDLGSGDITSDFIVPENKKVKAGIIARENFLLCGIPAAQKVFATVDSSVRFVANAKEGKIVRAGQILATAEGNARSILKSERVALNLLSFMSAVATKTNMFTRAIKPFKTKITDTRKTLPGLRALEKYAVRIGGGYNHRFSLDEMFLIKDNHLKISGGCPELPDRPKGRKIEIEAQNLDEFRRAMALKPDVIMLDNMPLQNIKKAVLIKGNLKVLLEASGGINIHNIKKYAAAGVDLISVGQLTDSVSSVDISLEII